MQDVEIEYWLNQADNYAEVSIPCDDLRSLIARAISPAPSVSGLTEEERAGLAAIRARHDAALARMADNNWPMSEGRQDIAALLAIVDKMRADQ
jgi:hypothetical protein